MLTSIKNLACLSEVDELESYLEYPGSANCLNGVFLLIENDEYKGYKLEELDREKTSKYLYPKKRSPRGPNKTPTIKYNDFKTSYIGKIYDWFQKYGKNNEKFQELKTVLEQNQKLINVHLNEIPKNSFLSIKLNNKYIGEIYEFKKLVSDDDEIKTDISTDSCANKPLVLKNELCSVCNEKKEELFGFVIPFTFYTLKDNKFSYNLDANNSVKQCPICIECAKKIRGNGENFLENNLNFRLCNSKYFLLPEFIFQSEENTEKFKTIIKKIKKSRENVSQSKEAESLIISEDRILKEFENENYLFLNLFFYEKEQSAFRILANIEEVLPSKLKRFYQVVKIVNDKFNDLSITVGSGEKERFIEFNFSVLSNILDDPKKNVLKQTKKEFFEILDKTLNFKTISEEFLFKKALNNLKFYHSNRNDEKNGGLYKYNFKKLSFESFMYLNILYTLDITTNRKDVMENIETPNLDLFCNEFPEFFNSPLRKGVFALGVLTEQLGYIQTKNGSSKAIYSSLKDFKMDLKHLQEKLIPNLKKKFHQYKKDFYYEKFAEEVSNCFMKGKSENISTGELNYIFILGMNSSKKLYNKLFNEKEKDVELV